MEPWSEVQEGACIQRGAHLGLIAVVAGQHADGGCPALLGVVPQQDVGHGDDDEGLGGVREPREDAAHGAEQHQPVLCVLQQQQPTRGSAPLSSLAL